jgi:hypothetical protein
MKKTKTYLGMVEMFFVIIIGIWASTVLWTSLVTYLEKPAFEILSYTTTKTGTLGQNIILNIEIIKRKDCPGNFVHRITDSKGHTYDLASGILGINPPSEYTFRRKVKIPSEMAPGPAVITQVAVVTCDGQSGQVDRAETNIEILD